MRLLFLLVLLGSASTPTAAQIQRSAPAFETAISPWVGITSFGNRHSSNELEATFRSSATVGLRGDLPLTQRLGVLASVAISPVAKQRVEGPITTTLHERVTVARAEAALGWRVVARAPVFFFGGGGIMRASLSAYPGFDEAPIEPRALFGVGYDHPTSGRLNFRVTITGYVSKPQDPDPDNWRGTGAVHAVTTRSAVFDWGMEIGARYRFRRGS